MSEKILGKLACGACRGPRIHLGTDECGREVSVPSVLQDVISRESNGLLRLSCGHFSGGFPISDKEFITLENGTIVRGPGFAEISNNPRIVLEGGL